jgi:hypothetical protein
MAEQVVIVCDVCGAPATSTVTIAVGGGSRAGQRFSKDLCDKHLTEALAGGRKPRRGRRRGSVSAEAAKPSPKARAPKAKAKATRRGRPRKAATAAKSARRGRPRKAVTTAAEPAPAEA